MFTSFLWQSRGVFLLLHHSWSFSCISSSICVVSQISQQIQPKFIAMKPVCFFPCVCQICHWITSPFSQQCSLMSAIVLATVEEKRWEDKTKGRKVRLLLLSCLKSTVKLHPPYRLSLTEWSSVWEMKLDFINGPKTQVPLPNVEYLYFHAHSFWGNSLRSALFSFPHPKFALLCELCYTVR